MKPFIVLFFVLCSLSLLGCDTSDKAVIKQNNSITDTMKIKITIGERVLTATVFDNPTSKDFISLLPLTLTLTDYNNTEKISDLPKRLSTRDAPVGYKPAAGDLTLYAPWGNLAIFYKGFSYSNGLIALGKLNGGIEAFAGSDPLIVKIEIQQ